MHHSTDRIAHTTAFDKPVVEHWLERDIAQRVHHVGSIRRPTAREANNIITELRFAPHLKLNTFNLTIIDVWLRIREKIRSRHIMDYSFTYSNKGYFLWTTP